MEIHWSAAQGAWEYLDGLTVYGAEKLNPPTPPASNQAPSFLSLLQKTFIKEQATDIRTVCFYGQQINTTAESERSYYKLKEEVFLLDRGTVFSDKHMADIQSFTSLYFYLEEKTV